MIRNLRLTFLIALLLTSCKKPSPPAPAGPVQLSPERVIFQIAAGDYPIDASFSVDGETLAISCTNKTVHCFDNNSDSGPKETSSYSFTLLIRHAALSPSGKVLAMTFAPGARPGSASEASCLRFLAVKPMAPTIEPVVLPPEASFDQLAFSADGTMLAVGIDDPPANNRVEILAIPTGQVKSRIVFESSSAPPTSIAFSPDNQLLAVSCGRVVHFIETAGGKDNAMIIGTEKATDSIASVAFSMDSKTLAVLSTDGNLSLWDPATRNEKLIDNKKVHRRIHPGTLPMPIAFSPDGKYLAVFSPDEPMLLDAKSLTTLVNLTGISKPITSFAFGPAGQKLVTTDQSGAVKLWKLE